MQKLTASSGLPHLARRGVTYSSKPGGTCKMKLARRLLLSASLVAAAFGACAAPAAAQVTTSSALIPCSFCSLPDTWVWKNTGPVGDPSAATYPALVSFHSDGTVDADDQLGVTYHGTWARIGTFTYAATLLKINSDQSWD